MNHQHVVVPPPSKKKKEAPVPVPFEFMVIEYPKADIEKYNVRSAAMTIKGFPWTAGVFSYVNDCLEEVVSIRVMNNKSDDSECWFCDAKLTLVIGNKDTTKDIFFQEQFFRFSPDRNQYVFNNVFIREDLVADPGFFPHDQLCRITIGIAVLSIPGNKFYKRLQIDWSDEMTGSDCCLVVGGKDFYVGKHMLVRHTSYFDSMFYGSFKESKMDRIELHDIPKEDFELFLNYIHNFGVTMNENTVWGLLDIGHRFEAKAILLDAEKFLMKTREVDLSERLVLADKYQMYALKNSCLGQYTSIDVINHIKYSDHWSELSQDTKDVIFEKLLFLSNALSQIPPQQQQQQQNAFGYPGPSTSSFIAPSYPNNNHNYPPAFNQGPSTSHGMPPLVPLHPPSNQFLGGSMMNSNSLPSSSQMYGMGRSATMMPSSSMMQQVPSSGYMGSNPPNHSNAPPGFNHPTNPAPLPLPRKPTVRKGRPTKAAQLAAALASQNAAGALAQAYGNHSSS